MVKRSVATNVPSSTIAGSQKNRGYNWHLEIKTPFAKQTAHL
jgi:hypothetical protein